MKLDGSFSNFSICFLVESSTCNPIRGCSQHMLRKLFTNSYLFKPTYAPSPLHQLLRFYHIPSGFKETGEGRVESPF